MRALAAPYDVSGLQIEALDDPARADALVAEYIQSLDLPTFPVSPAGIHVSMLDDADGTSRVAFVMNPTPTTVVATVSLGRARALVDLLPRTRDVKRIDVQAGGFVVEVPARTARMFAVE
jgi:hypothetical protein